MTSCEKHYQPSCLLQLAPHSKQENRNQQEQKQEQKKSIKDRPKKMMKCTPRKCSLDMDIQSSHKSQKINGPLPEVFFMSIHHPSISLPPGMMTASYPWTQRDDVEDQLDCSMPSVFSQITKQTRNQPGSSPYSRSIGSIKPNMGLAASRLAPSVFW